MACPNHSRRSRNKRLKQTTISFLPASFKASEQLTSIDPSSFNRSICQYSSPEEDSVEDHWDIPSACDNLNTYKRRISRKDCNPDVSVELEDPPRLEGLCIPEDAFHVEDQCKEESKNYGILKPISHYSLPQNCSFGPVFYKKPSQQRKVMGQYFLDLGQSDFFYTTCKACGLFYARGHEEDEKLHKSVHKTYLQGIQFKGWQKERLVVKYDINDERIILVLPTDPSQNQLKVKEVTSIMETELGLIPGWLLHNQCKVYFFISTKQVVGCAVVEPIKEAYRVICDEVPSVQADETTVCLSQEKGSLEESLCCTPDSVQPCAKNVDGPFKQAHSHCPNRNNLSKTLVFGNVKFEREVTRSLKCKSEKGLSTLQHTTTICSKKPVSAVCGVRAIWVSGAERRRGIATKLLDAARSTFFYGCIVDASQCAFSQPTLQGKAFAAKYCKTESFLVYS